MKTQILKILRETFIPEAEVDKHTVDRVSDRVLSIPDGDLPKEKKEKIIDKIYEISKHDFDINESYIIFLGDFTPNPKSNLYGEYKGIPFYDVGGSQGNQFWVIIRNNSIDTLMLRMSNQTYNNVSNARDVRVDYAIKDFNKYIKQIEKSKIKKKQTNIRREKQPIVPINGVKWVVDINREIIYKKNKPSVNHRVIDMIDSVDEKTQEDIMSFF